MESTKAITKEFECRKHPGEKIQRISSIAGSNAVYCIDCLLSIEDKHTKNTIIPIKEFIQRTVAHFEKNTPQGTTLKGEPPQELLAVLEGEDELISKVSAHIESEKLKVEVSFGEIIQDFNSLCNKAKQELFVDLDNQLLNFRNNFLYYKKRLNKFYGKETESETAALTTESGIISSINNCESSADLEFLIKQIYDEIRESGLFESFSNRTEGISVMLKELKNSIKKQGELLPTTIFSDPMKSQEIIEKLKKPLAQFAQEAHRIEHKIMPLSMSSSYEFDSKIVTNSDHQEMISGWLSSQPQRLMLKLLFRATRDGFLASTFHKKCDNIKNTLVLVKVAGTGKMCGGFTELEWNAIESHKHQERSFLFSVNEKAKFPLKQKQYSIYGGKDAGPSFGGGCDLYLGDNCNLSKASYSNFGHTYEAGDMDKTTLTGSYNFSVEDYEVFEVEGYKAD